MNTLMVGLVLVDVGHYGLMPLELLNPSGPL